MRGKARRCALAMARGVRAAAIFVSQRGDPAQDAAIDRKSKNPGKYIRRKMGCR
jgi:hypothetical protein